MSDQTHEQVKPITEIPDPSEFIQKRMVAIDPLIEQVLEATVKAIRQGTPAVDIVEALGVVAANIMIMGVKPDARESVQEHAVTIYNDTLEILKSSNIGVGSSIASQVTAQAKVLAYLANTAAWTIDQAKKALEEEEKNGSVASTPVDARQ